MLGPIDGIQRDSSPPARAGGKWHIRNDSAVQQPHMSPVFHSRPTLCAILPHARPLLDSPRIPSLQHQQQSQQQIETDRPWLALQRKRARRRPESSCSALELSA